MKLSSLFVIKYITDSCTFLFDHENLRVINLTIKHVLGMHFWAPQT